MDSRIDKLEEKIAALVARDNRMAKKAEVFDEALTSDAFFSLQAVHLLCGRDLAHDRAHPLTSCSRRAHYYRAKCRCRLFLRVAGGAPHGVRAARTLQ